MGLVPDEGAVQERRCSTASWWRSIKISAVFHVSSRRDSRNPAATRVIRRNTNSRHMIGDHHGRTAGRATLLIRAVGEIFGTHRSVALLGDAIHNLSDVSTSAVVFLGFWVSKKPASRRHPTGMSGRRTWPGSAWHWSSG